MAGAIIGTYGFQRSGKTLLSYLVADTYRKKYDYPVFSNMKVPNWTYLENLSDLPINQDPKILLLDEAYFFLDSRNWKKNAESTIFFNTIGKQNILLLLTGIDPGEVDIRIRRQHNYLIITKKSMDIVHYRIFNTQKDTYKDIQLKLGPELFRSITYDDKQIPMPLNLDIDNFIEKVKTYNKQQQQTKKET